MRDPSERLSMRAVPGGERWHVRRQGRPLGAAVLALAGVFAALAVAAATTESPTAAERDVLTAVAGVCALLALLCAAAGVNLARSGLRLHAEGVTCQGAVLRRRLRWSDVTGFSAAVEEPILNRPAAIALARLRDGRYVALPGTRVEGVRWNLDEHRRVAAFIAAELDARRRRSVDVQLPG